jgi:hypothetical protein
LSLGENLNVQPVKLPLFVNAQLGFAAVYLLADYDDIARKLILAHHTALIDRSTLERWLNEGAHALRSLFSLAQQYRYSGCTRDDFAAKNAAARARWRSSASCRRTCSKARAARSLRHPSCAVVCNSAVRILPQPLPASMVMRPLLPTRPKAQPLPARTNPHERSEPADPLLPGPATGSLHAPGTRGLSKGLLKPFKGKGDLEAWASQCFAMRDELIGLAQRQVLQQAVGIPSTCCPWNWPSRPLAQARRSCAGASTTARPWAWPCGRS